MKKSHKLPAHTAGPVWGLVFGLVMTAVAVVLWLYGQAHQGASHLDESLAVAAALIGVFVAVCAGREIRHNH
jgi:hypothetical protein